MHTFDLWLLDAIKEVVKGAGFSDPLPQYSSAVADALEKAKAKVIEFSGNPHYEPDKAEVMQRLLPNRYQQMQLPAAVLQERRQQQQQQQAEQAAAEAEVAAAAAAAAPFLLATDFGDFEEAAMEAATRRRPTQQAHNAVPAAAPGTLLCWSPSMLHKRRVSCC
jgi:hypothetical protein